MNQVQFWTDSTDLLWWVNKETRCFKPLAANRIGEIHNISQPYQWCHVPSQENLADIASKGCSAKDLINNELWWTGATFLYRSSNECPKSDIREAENSRTERSKCLQLDEYHIYNSEKKQLLIA